MKHNCPLFCCCRFSVLSERIVASFRGHVVCLFYPFGRPHLLYKLLTSIWQITVENMVYTAFTNESKLTALVRDDNDWLTNISISFWSWSKHCYAVVGVFIESCKNRFSCWRIHHLGPCTTTRKWCVGNCVAQYNAILSSWGNITPLNQNTSWTCVVSLDIKWRSIWLWVKE